MKRTREPTLWMEGERDRKRIRVGPRGGVTRPSVPAPTSIRWEVRPLPVPPPRVTITGQDSEIVDMEVDQDEPQAEPPAEPARPYICHVHAHDPTVCGIYDCGGVRDPERKYTSPTSVSYIG